MTALWDRQAVPQAGGWSSSRRAVERLGQRRSGFLVAAACIAISTIMLLPLLASVLASLKTTAEAAAVPPTYFPHALSLDSYERLWNYQAGLLTYFGNSAGAAGLTMVAAGVWPVEKVLSETSDCVAPGVRWVMKDKLLSPINRAMLHGQI